MKNLLITFAILLLLGAGYFTYEKWVKHANLTLWSFVPADATLVVEAEVMEDLNIIQGYPVWNSFKESSGMSNLNEGLAFLDSVNGQGGFSAIFEEVPAIISLHKVSSSNIDFLFVIELQNISQNTFANAAIGRLNESGYRFKTRNYNDFKISEISKNGKVLTFIFYKNFFLASFTPYLVEDAVRVLKEPTLISFKEKFTSIASPTPKGLLSIHINYDQFERTIGAFATGGVDIPFESGTYEVMIDSGFIQFSGLSNHAPADWMMTHTSQPTPFEIAEVVPENTAYLYHVSSGDISEWKDAQVHYVRSTFPKIKTYQDSLKRSYDFNADQVLDLVDNELGLINLESPRSRDHQKMFVLEVNDIGESLTFFSQLTERIAIARGDSVYSESYSENEIRFLPIPDFPSTLLGDLASGFDQCFYMNYRNYLIFSNDLQELKNLIKNVNEENTWGKSIQMNQFLERANNAANVSLIVNVPRAWSRVTTSLKNEWLGHFKKNSSIYKGIELAAFQYSYLDGKFYTNYTFTQPASLPKNIPKTNADNGVRFVSSLTTKPFLVKTHAYKDFDIIVQDSSNTIYYLNQQQNAQWTETLSSPLVSSIYPIDYYRNGKIQYLFATEQKAHIIDRTGTYIPGYPKSLPQQAKIEHLNLVDYDASRNYRIAITDKDGNVYLTDKNLKPLDGWNPMQFTRRAVQPLSHARLGRRDVMISIQENGIINILSRRGNRMKGFPFDIKQALGKEYFLRQSNGLANSSITVLSSGGELTELNLEGDVIKRDQLIKTSADAKFRLIPDTGGDAFIIVRQEGSSFEVLDDTGNLLFKKNYISEQPVLIQYYQFGAGKDLVIFTDVANKSLYIYDKSGNLITGNPLRSEHEVSLIYSSARREFQVFTTWDANLELYKFNY